MVYSVWVMVSFGKLTSPEGNQGKGTNSVAESTAKQYGLTKTSGLRTDEDVQKGIGYSGDDHHKGTAADFSGSPKDMEAFAKDAAASGDYKKVIWKGRDLISGVKVPGHEDHVHISW